MKTLLLLVLFIVTHALPTLAYDCFKFGNGIYEQHSKYRSGQYTMVDDMWLNYGTGQIEFSSHLIEADPNVYYYHAGSFSVDSWDEQNTQWVQTDSIMMSTNEKYLFSATAKASLDNLMAEANIHLPSENLETGCSVPDPQPPRPSDIGALDGKCFKFGNGIYANLSRYHSGQYTMVDDIWLNYNSGEIEFSSYLIDADTDVNHHHAGSFSVETWDEQNTKWVQTDSIMMSTNERYLFSTTAKASLDNLMSESNIHLPSENLETGCSLPDPQPVKPSNPENPIYKCFKFSNGIYDQHSKYHSGQYTMVDDMWINYDTGQIELSSYPIDGDPDVYHYHAGSFSVQVWDKQALQWITTDSRMMSTNERYLFSANAKNSLENLQALPEVFPTSENLSCLSSGFELDCRTGQGICEPPPCSDQVDVDGDGVNECADCDDADPAIGADCLSQDGPPEKCGDQGYQGNPISIYNGNKFEQKIDLDIATPNRNGLQLVRYYNSRSGTSGTLGHNWSHSFDQTLALNVVFGSSSFLQIKDGGGKEYYFSDSGSNRWDGELHEESHVMVDASAYTWYHLDGSAYHFSSTGVLEWVDDALGNRQTLAFDQNGSLQTVTDEATGRVLLFNYTNNLLTTISGPASATVADNILVTYGYDTNANLTSVIYGDGSGLTYEYNDSNDIHNLTAKRDRSDHLIASWSYDAQDRANQSFTRDGQGVTVNYLSDLQVEVTDAYGVTKAYDFVYSKGNKKISTVSGPAGCTSCGNDSQPIRYAYDNNFRIAEEEFANGTINRYDLYNTKGQAQKVIYSVGTPEQRTIYSTYHPDLEAKLSQREYSVLSVGNNKETIWDYDDPNATGDNDTANENPTRLLYRKIARGYTHDSSQVEIPYEEITTYQYNSRGQITAIDGPLAGTEDTTTFSYDQVTGDILGETRPLIGTTTYGGHDAAGNPTLVTDINGQQATLVYDGSNRVIGSSKNGISVSMTYNVDGQLETITSGTNSITTYSYDSIYGRLEKVTGPLGNFMSYGYDGQGNRIDESIFDSEAVRKFNQGYDYQEPTYPGKLWKIVNFDSSETVFGYDNQGNRTSVQDPVNVVTSNIYDSMNRLKTTSLPGPVDTSFTYDGHGNLTTVTDGEGRVTSYIYDDRGKVISNTSPDTGTTYYTFDAVGNMLSKTDALGITVSYAYDSLSRLTGVSFPDTSQNITYTYDQGQNGIGRLSSMTDPSGNQIFEYDVHGRLVKETRVINSLSFVFSYGYDNNHQLTSITYPSNRTVNYLRDAAGQVVSVQSVTTGQTEYLASNIAYYPFGPLASMTMGNGVTENRTYDESYRLSSKTVGTVLSLGHGYFADGNLETINDNLNSVNNQSYTYDDFKRLTSANGKYGTVSYGYDKTGNRMSRTLNTQVETYSYVAGTSKILDINATSYTHDANGNIKTVGSRTFTYNQNNRLTEVVDAGTMLGQYSYNGLGQRTKKIAGGKTTLFLYDQAGNLVVEANELGEVQTEYVYLNGAKLAKFGKDPLADNLRFPGQYYDAETGLFYNWQRYYDPSTGRYLTPDPIGLAGGINIFLYANANPVNFVDPMGLWGFAIDAGGAYATGDGSEKYSDAGSAGTGVYIGGRDLKNPGERGNHAEIGGFSYQGRGDAAGAKIGLGVNFTHYKTDADDFFKGSLRYKSVSFLGGTLVKYYDECGNEVGWTIGLLGKGVGFSKEGGTVQGWSSSLQ